MKSVCNIKNLQELVILDQQEYPDSYIKNLQLQVEEVKGVTISLANNVPEKLSIVRVNLDLPNLPNFEKFHNYPCDFSDLNNTPMFNGLSTPYQMRFNAPFKTEKSHKISFTPEEIKKQYEILLKRNKMLREFVMPIIAEARVFGKNSNVQQINKFERRYTGPFKVIQIDKKKNMLQVVDRNNTTKDIKTQNVYPSGLHVEDMEAFDQIHDNEMNEIDSLKLTDEELVFKNITKENKNEKKNTKQNKNEKIDQKQNKEETKIIDSSEKSESVKHSTTVVKSRKKNKKKVATEIIKQNATGKILDDAPNSFELDIDPVLEDSNFEKELLARIAPSKRIAKELKDKTDILQNDFTDDDHIAYTPSLPGKRVKKPTKRLIEDM
eukprot:gene5580-9396_t